MQLYQKSSPDFQHHHHHHPSHKEPCPCCSCGISQFGSVHPICSLSKKRRKGIWDAKIQTAYTTCGVLLLFLMMQRRLIIWMVVWPLWLTVDRLKNVQDVILEQSLYSVMTGGFRISLYFSKCCGDNCDLTYTGDRCERYKFSGSSKYKCGLYPSLLYCLLIDNKESGPDLRLKGAD